MFGLVCLTAPWVRPRCSLTKRVPGLKPGRRRSRRAALLSRWSKRLVYPPTHLSWCSLNKICTMSDRLRCFGGGVPITSVHLNISASRLSASSSDNISSICLLRTNPSYWAEPAAVSGVPQHKPYAIPQVQSFLRCKGWLACNHCLNTLMRIEVTYFGLSNAALLLSVPPD